ncbi:hypothetical protein [Reyranella sp.]|uniref:hypothetical protein n=1 Tax=Reyranella sp. TaxID=1929291 RepID=UPI0012272D34|nr:hypothetical protein [Reyranella sp.]TAJ82881.1 MAG: hypothetical protein EPO50_24580 [Reyranella sp.]
MSVYWNAVQACIWIATHDERLVAQAQTDKRLNTIFVADETFSSRSLRDASHDVNMKAVRRGQPTRPTVFESRHLLTAACAAGTLTMLGRACGEGDPVEIPAIAWAKLELRDDSRFGVIAASPDICDRRATWWDELRVASREVRRHLPFPRERVTAWSGLIDGRPDTVGEAAWAERRRRQFMSVQAAVLPLGNDGLPDEVEITLVEALSWCALGCAVPPGFWAADYDVGQADRDYASARESLAYALWRFRSAKTIKESPFDTGLPPNGIKAEYLGAASNVERAKQYKEEVAQKFNAAISRKLLLDQVRSDARHRQGAPDADADFVQRSLDKAERRLLRAFLGGELECLGRRSDDASIWESLPKDCFRLPVEVRLNHNILEPSSRATMDEHRLVMEGPTKWRSLRVNTAALRTWWAGRSAASSLSQSVQPGPVLVDAGAAARSLMKIRCRPSRRR